MKISSNGFTIEVDEEAFVENMTPDIAKKIFESVVASGDFENFLNDISEGEVFFDGSYGSSNSVSASMKETDYVEEARKLLTKYSDGLVHASNDYLRKLYSRTCDWMDDLASKCSFVESKNKFLEEEILGNQEKIKELTAENKQLKKEVSEGKERVEEIEELALRS